MKILIIFALYLISEGSGVSNEVTGYLGGRVLIQCKYSTEYTSNQKYFCKRSWRASCPEMIATKSKNKWVNDGRFALMDNTSSEEFSVMIKELTAYDSGTYECRVALDWGFDINSPVELKISEDRNYRKSISVNGKKGSEVNISCNYPQSLSSKPKFLCRKEGPTDCLYESSVKVSGGWVQEGQFSLHDDRAKKIFIVTINHLAVKDTGEYWCGAESDWESNHEFKVYFTQIYLRVSAEPGPPETSTPSSSSHSAKPLKTSEHPSQTNTTPTTEFPTSSVIIAVSVILVLLLVGLLLFIIVLRKRLKTQASTPVQSPGVYSTTNTVYAADINDPKHPRSSHTGASTVHSTAQLPTIPADLSQPLYDNVQFQQRPNPMYTTAPEQGIYATPQSTTNPSNAEDPDYATVKFTKHDVVTMATVNRMEESCDYAAIKHGTGSG